MPKKSALDELLAVMANLRSPEGCPWDREQDHMSLRYHAVEEVYELIDAIEAGDDAEMSEELGDLLGEKKTCAVLVLQDVVVGRPAQPAEFLGVGLVETQVAVVGSDQGSPSQVIRG